ncbi:MAG: helix-turn-helix transcriptional regulator [Ruminococcus sp.]|nr:helix-turn-helix transcriptional regulator [Ruminococcus sp.]
MTEYQLFPDIRLISRKVCMHSDNDTPPLHRDVLEIGYCSSGRSEYREGKYHYFLSEGEIIIRRRQADETVPYFPTGQYEGASLYIEYGSCPDNLAELLEGTIFSPRRLADELCTDECFIADGNEKASQVFAELYSGRDRKPLGWLRIKTAELLIELASLHKESSLARNHRCPEAQVRLAKDVCSFACSNLNEHYTIQQLADMEKVNPTKLKACFKRVYGCSMYSYVRTQKMYAAADLLKKTDRTVLDIACECGFDNGSKFAKAFREVMGSVPSKYR